MIVFSINKAFQLVEFQGKKKPEERNWQVEQTPKEGFETPSEWTVKNTWMGPTNKGVYERRGMERLQDG